MRGSACFAILATALLLAACGSDSTSYYGQVVGSVAGEPLRGATVVYVADGVSHTTAGDSSGSFTLSFPKDKVPASVELTISKAGYKDLKKKVDLDPKDHNLSTFGLEKAAPAK